MPELHQKPSFYLFIYFSDCSAFSMQVRQQNEVIEKTRFFGISDKTNFETHIFNQYVVYYINVTTIATKTDAVIKVFLANSQTIENDQKQMTNITKAKYI